MYRHRAQGTEPSILPIAVFASGEGSNFQAILDKIKAGELPVAVRLLVSDRPEAPVVVRARQYGIEVMALSPKEYPDKASYERTILQHVQDHGVEWLVLAGYMRLVGPTLLFAYEGRIVNIHPSLLPAFPGKDAVGQALAHGVKVTGVTVHLVDEGMDTGAIIAQEAVPVLAGDTRDTLSARIQQVEHRLLPDVLLSIAQGGPTPLYIQRENLF